jgi:glutamate dehydrogenase (NAD(P)+)
MYTLREAAKEFNIDLKKATIAIQGYGNAGSYAHSLAEELFGSKVVAVSDSKGGSYNANGIDAGVAARTKAETSTVASIPGAKKISNEDLLELDVDILIAAALENVITKDNAGNIKAKIVVELANGPTTPEADEILYKNNIHVIPDFLANAGGVTVSYFEMVQNIMRYCWSFDEVYLKLDERMTMAYKGVLAASKQYSINMRQAAYTVAVARVVEAMKMRGWV